MGKREAKIIDLVRQKKAEINDPAKALENKRLAIAAINGGPGSTAWMVYMKQFVSNDDAEQLNRLTAMDDTREDPDMMERRAYLVSNAVCGQGTKGHFDENVDTIDIGLEVNNKPA